MRILVIAACTVLLAQPVLAQSEFEPQYQEARTKSIWSGVGTAAGVVLLIVGITISSASSQEESYQLPIGGFLAAGAGGGIGTFSGIMLAGSIGEMQRLDYAMEHESSFSARETEAVKNEDIFVGMSDEALIASWWRPYEINPSSYGPDQWVYGYQYVYVDDGEVDGWN